MPVRPRLVELDPDRLRRDRRDRRVHPDDHERNEDRLDSFSATGQVGWCHECDGHANSFAPLRIGADSNWGSLGLGGAFSCATKAGGQLWCWGLNTSGQLGDTTNFDHNTPERIGTAANWSSVDGGFNHTAGIQRAS